MKSLRVSLRVVSALIVLSGVAKAVPVVYTNEALFQAELTALEGSTLHESFEDDIVWADSRSSIPSPGSTPAVTSQGIVWTSNFAQNKISTGTVGGDAPDGTYALYSIPHGITNDSGLYCDDAEDPIPNQCYQNDGLRVESEAGNALLAFGGRIDTANSGKVTFLLDGVDINGNNTDNIDNWQREGDFADNWDFVGVIDTAGFFSAELRELRGKDFQQVLLFADDFTLQQSAISPLLGDYNANGTVDAADYTVWRDGNSPDDTITGYNLWATHFGEIASNSNAIPEPGTLLLAILAATTLLPAPRLSNRRLAPGG